MYSHLYIHVPFCRRKCDYCGFYSESDRHLAVAYLNKLERDLIAESANLQDLRSIYIGGGTPTYLLQGDLDRLFNLINQHVGLVSGAEISIESNPETLNASNVDFLQERITRISMGVQSFEPSLRKVLGRDTTQNAIEQALSLIKQSKIPHFNCDLIYGIPEQSKASFFADVLRAVDAGIDHLSCYSLTIEPDTPLARRQRTNYEELEAEEFEELQNLLMPHGISQYEISNYAKANGRCRHNWEIWGGATYLGVGPSAASFNGVDRFCQVANLKSWLNSEPPEYDKITPLSRLMEVVIMRLRTTDGWNKDEFEGLDLSCRIGFSWDDLLAKAQNIAMLYPGCITVQQNSLSLTLNGLLVWNNIAQEFLE